MKPNQLKLIRILMEQPQSIKANLLAGKMGVSLRTIKSYIHEINEEFPETVISSRNGYNICTEKAKRIIDNSHSHIPQTSKERVTYILNKLIRQKHAIDVYDLSDELYVSLSTLKNELNKVKRIVSKYDLQLDHALDFIKLKGLEKNKRKMLSTLLYNESNVNFVNLNSLQNAFVDIDIVYIKNTVLEIFETYHYFINDYSLINLVLHITIAIDRIRNNNINTQDIQELPMIRLHEYELSKLITKRLEAHFDIQYSDAEVYEMTLLIISRATTIDYKSINTTNLQEFVGEDCFKLVQQLIRDISAYCYIDLSEQEFLIRFALHIRNLLVRSKNNYFSKNPLTEGIKTSCPLIYDISVSLAATIKEKTGVFINDDEIAYIAFHLGSTLEAQKNLTEKVTAVLYCPNYYDMNLRITDSINQYFSSELLITNILTDESEFERIKDLDLIITTIPIASILNYPLLQIHLFLNEKDQNNLKMMIGDLRKKKKRKEFENYLRELIIPEFFVKQNHVETKENCIESMVENLVKLGYVQSTFIDEIYEREKMSSTAFQLFAIPHAMKMNALKTGIHVLINESGVAWDEKNVHLVMMLCFNINERHIFNEIFDPITMILSETENIQRLIVSETYDEFIQLFVSLL